MGQCSSLFPGDIDKDPEFARETGVDTSTVVFSSFLPKEILTGIEDVLDQATWKYGWKSK
jgi:hypothetical protein